MSNEAPTMTPEREAFLKEVLSGEFAKKLPDQFTNLSAIGRQEIGSQISETGHHIAALSILLGGDGAVDVKTAGVIGAIQTIAVHIAMSTVAQGASSVEARAVVLAWLEQLAGDSARMCSFIFEQRPEDLVLSPKYLTAPEVEKAARNASEKIGQAKPILFNSLAVHMTRLLTNLRDRHFTAAIRLRFGKLLDVWAAEAEAQMQDVLGVGQTPQAGQHISPTKH